jgi:hypothetical protein
VIIKNLITGIFFLQSFFLLDTQNIYTIDTKGRPIQIDAFLIEWNISSVKKINSPTPFFWDAMNTSQGISGYFRFPVNDSCEKIAVDIFTSLDKTKRSISIQTDTIPSSKTHYAVEKIDNQEGKSVITEWIIPWDCIPTDSIGKYEIEFFIHNTCGDNSHPIFFKGVKTEDTDESKYTKQIIIQIFSIAVLLGLFLILKKRIKFR